MTMSANYDILCQELTPSISDRKTFEEMEWPDLSDTRFSVQQSNQNGWVQHQRHANNIAEFQQNHNLNKNQRFATPGELLNFQNKNWQHEVSVNNNYYTQISYQNGDGNIMIQPQFQPMIPVQVPQIHQGVTMMMQQNMMSQIPMYQQYHQQIQPQSSANQRSMVSPYPVPEYQGRTIRKGHEALISVEPRSSRGFKEIKRKRKRTMFTTEQVNFLEEAYHRTPYVTRESRQSIVRELQVSDSAVKIWFQNRRIRHKKELEESQNSCHEPNCCSGRGESFFKPEPVPILAEKAPSVTTKDYYNNCMSSIFDSPSNSSVSEPTSSPINLQVDELEAELLPKVDNLGYISLTEKNIQDIVNLIDKVLPADVKIDNNMDTQAVTEKLDKSRIDKSVAQEPIKLDTIDLTVVELNNSLKPIVKEDFLLDIKMNDPTEVQCEVVVESTEDSDGSTVYDGSIYEPISPALPDGLRVDDPNAWNPSKETRDKLFNVFFC